MSYSRREDCREMNNRRRRRSTPVRAGDRPHHPPGSSGLSQSAFHQKFQENYMKRLTGDRSNDLYQSAFPLKHIPERLNFSYRLLGRNIFTKSPPKIHDSDDEIGRGGRRSTRAEKRYKNYLRFQAQQGTLGNDPTVSSKSSHHHHHHHHHHHSNQQQQQTQQQQQQQQSTLPRDSSRQLNQPPQQQHSPTDDDAAVSNDRRKRRRRSISIRKKRRGKRRRSPMSSACSTCSSSDSCEECRKTRKKRTRRKRRDKSPVLDEKIEPRSDSDPDDETVELKPIVAFLDDREKLLEEMLKSVGRRRLDAIMPDILRQRPIDDVKARCLDQLECMSKKRIKCILEGQEMLASSGTDDDDEEKSKSIQEESSFVPVPRPLNSALVDQQQMSSAFEEHEIRRNTFMDIRIKTTSLSGLIADTGNARALNPRMELNPVQSLFSESSIRMESVKQRKEIPKLSPEWASALESPTIPDVPKLESDAEALPNEPAAEETTRLWSSADEKDTRNVSSDDCTGSVSTVDLLTDTYQQQQQNHSSKNNGKAANRAGKRIRELRAPIKTKWINNYQCQSQSNDDNDVQLGSDEDMTFFDKLCGPFV